MMQRNLWAEWMQSKWCHNEPWIWFITLMYCAPQILVYTFGVDFAWNSFVNACWAIPWLKLWIQLKAMVTVQNRWRREQVYQTQVEYLRGNMYIVCCVCCKWSFALVSNQQKRASGAPSNLSQTFRLSSRGITKNSAETTSGTDPPGCWGWSDLAAFEILFGCLPHSFVLLPPLKHSEALQHSKPLQNALNLSKTLEY